MQRPRLRIRHPRRPPPKVGILTIQPAPITLTTELTGRTKPYLVAEIRPQVGGLVRARLFTEGALVQAGQVLYEIDPVFFRASLDSAQAGLARSQANLTAARLKAERNATLVKTKVISQQDNDDAQAALQQASAGVAVDRAALAQARINLDYTHVTAPITGQIGRSSVTVGALVTANQPQTLAVIQQLDPIYVDLIEPSTEWLNLRGTAKSAGQTHRSAVRLILENGQRYPLEGRLEFSEVTVEPGTGAIVLRALFRNPNQVLLPGMFVRAVLETGTLDRAVRVPAQAVSRDAKGKPWVMLLGRENQVERRTLPAAEWVDGAWLVREGLSEGDRLIVEGLQFVRPGLPIRQGIQSPCVGHHCSGLVKGPNHVFTQGMIDPRFASHRGVDLGQQGGGYLHKGHPALITSSGKPCDVANDAAAQGDQGGLAIKVACHQVIEDP